MTEVASPVPAHAQVTVDREQLLVELVDRGGRPLGTCPVGEAHTAPGRLHRAFSVLLYDPAGHPFCIIAAIEPLTSPAE